MLNRLLFSSIYTSVVSILFLLLIFGFSQFCLAQKDQNLDSLFNALQKAKVDTNKVNTLNEISDQLWRSDNYALAKNYADSALALSLKTQFKKGIVNANINLGEVYKKLANYPEALKSFLISLKLSEEIGYKIGIASSYKNLGFVYQKQGNIEQAFKNLFTALNIYEEIKNQNGISLCYSNLGGIYMDKGNYTEAKINYLTALKMSENLGNKKVSASINSNIGGIHMIQGNYPEAMKCYLASIKIRFEIGDKKGIANSYNNIGGIHVYYGNYPEALNNFLAALRINEELGDKKAIAHSYSFIGTLYTSLENYPEALNHHLIALKFREKIGDKKEIANSYNDIGSIYIKICNYSEALKNLLVSVHLSEDIGNKAGVAASYLNIGAIHTEQGKYFEALDNYLPSLRIFKQIGHKKGIVICFRNLGYLNTKLSNYSEAKRYLDEALALSIDLRDLDEITNVYKCLSELSYSLGNHQQALEHYKLYTLYKDSLLNESNGKAIAELKTKYETEKKDKEIHQLESEKQISNLQLIFQQESFNLIQTEKAKIQAENLYNLQQVELLGNESKLQEFEMEKNQADLFVQKAESDRKQDLLVLLNKEGQIQKLEIKKQTLFRNYLIAGLVLFSFLGFFAYNNYSTRQKLKLQTLRNKIASDLHDDVGSTLSSISIFSQIAQEQSKEVIPLLDTIGESSRKMLDAMADIVWTINPENDQFEKIILRMRSFAYELLGAKNIDFEFIADDDISKIKLPMEVRKNLYLIFKEATNNMVKYSNADKAKFEIRNESDHLKLMIRDNGKGFDMHSSTQGNGIKNMMRRAEEIGAKLIIDSFPGNGTTIRLNIAL